MSAANWIIAHLEKQGTTYLLAAGLLVAMGAFAGSIGQQWLTQTIDGRVQFKLTGLESKVQGIERKLDAQYELLLAQQIREIAMQLCIAPNRLLDNRLEEAQQQYRQLTGTRYPVPPCPL